MGRGLESLWSHRLGPGKPDLRGDSSHAGPSADCFLALMHRQTCPGVKLWVQTGCAPSELLTPRRTGVRGSGVTRVPLKEAVPVIPTPFLEEIAVPPSLPAFPKRGGVSGQKHPGACRAFLVGPAPLLPWFGAQVLAVQRPGAQG